MITKDTGIEFEQNLTTLPCTVFVLRAKSNSLRDVSPLVPELLDRPQHFVPRAIVRIGRPNDA